MCLLFASLKYSFLIFFSFCFVATTIVLIGVDVLAEGLMLDGC